MAIVVRFVDRDGYVKERFLDLIHVKNTTALTLKNEILSSLSFHKLDVHDILGQGYDGASNMRREWKGLQALMLKECPYAQIFEISHLANIRELQSARGANQLQSLQRPGHTRWSSHYRLICSLLRLYGPTIIVLRDIAINGSTSSQKGIVNALCLVSTTKTLIQNLKDQGWESLLTKVVSFCEGNNIRVPKMSRSYKDVIRSHSKEDSVTVEHHYRVDVFFAAIDNQLQELNSRFNESVTELL
ncbi:uncharacterized protein [Rutidosis leptorrhynchoides]|uniref:uncharacterized protein n=1 Tax=Rutidosis leptorrhynchoides TaxID=125765 RepID=UPI003A99987D